MCFVLSVTSVPFVIFPLTWSILLSILIHTSHAICVNLRYSKIISPNLWGLADFPPSQRIHIEKYLTSDLLQFTFSNNI